MRNIVDIINDFEDDLYLHLDIEYSLNFVCETKCLIPGLSRIALHILNKIKENYNSQKIILTDCKSDFFDEIIIFIENSKNSIVSGETKLENCDEKHVEFGLLIPDECDDIELKSIIMHELTHIYQNWKYLIHGEDFKKALKKRCYQNYSNFKNANEILKQILYFCDKDEIPAYVQECITLLERENPNNAHDAFKIISETDYYRLLKGLYLNIDNLDDIFPEIFNEFRTIFPKKSHYKDDAINKMLKTMITKSYRKFLTKISKACVEHSHIVMRSSKNNIKNMNERLYETSTRIC